MKPDVGMKSRPMACDCRRGADLANDPIHQFQITKSIPIEIGGLDFSFTNSSAFMVATVAVAGGFLYLDDVEPRPGARPAAVDFRNVLRVRRQHAARRGRHAGHEVLPLVFSLFMFVLVANLLGMFPYFFTVTSHIIVTFALALLVIGTVVVYGFMKHGFGFLKLFVPQGVPGILLPLVVLIEVISFLSRPISLSVRLFANMLAGHITLKVFAGFVVVAERARRRRRRRRDPAAGHDGRAHGARIPGRLPAGLCLRGADLHVPQRRAASGSLDDIPPAGCSANRNTQDYRSTRS